MSESKFTILTWDCLDQPEWEAVQLALEKCRKPKISSIETGTQDFGIVIHPKEFPASNAQAYYDQHKHEPITRQNEGG